MDKIYHKSSLWNIVIHILFSFALLYVDFKLIINLLLSNQDDKINSIAVLILAILVSIAVFIETVIVLTQKYRVIDNLFEYSSIVGYRCCKLSEYSKTESYHLIIIVNLTILDFRNNKIILLLTNKEENYLKKRMHRLIYGNESYNIMYGK